jgi:hypothetical protein
MQELHGSALDQLGASILNEVDATREVAMVDPHAIDLNNDLSLSISYQLVSFPDHSLERLRFPVTENPSLCELAKWHRSKHNKSNRKQNVIQTTIEYTCDVKIASPQQHCIEKNPQK